MFDFLKKKKKRKTESRIDITENGVTITANGVVCMKDTPIPDAFRIFYALHFVFVNRYVYTVERTNRDENTDSYIRKDNVDLDPKKIDCQQYGNDIDVKYDGRLIYSGTETEASDVYLTLRNFIGEEYAQKIIEDPMGDYTVNLSK